jgi:hypothetical protein
VGAYPGKERLFDEKDSHLKEKNLDAFIENPPSM